MKKTIIAAILVFILAGCSGDLNIDKAPEGYTIEAANAEFASRDYIAMEGEEIDDSIKGFQKIYMPGEEEDSTSTGYGTIMVIIDQKAFYENAISMMTVTEAGTFYEIFIDFDETESRCGIYEGEDAECNDIYAYINEKNPEMIEEFDSVLKYFELDNKYTVGDASTLN